MSWLYGRVRGSAATSASRRGTHKSGITASVQSYDGSIICYMYYPDAEDEPYLRVSYHEDLSFYGNTIFNGPLSRFVEVLTKQ